MNRIFGAIKRAEDEWVWLDNLAIPAYLSAKVKADAINKMPMIYSNAKTVLILDALTMQLKTTSLTDVAVVLVCGKRITRAWCYQEIKLANFENVFILVSDGRASVDSMFQQLQLLAPNDESLFVRLFRTFNRLRMPVTELSLADIAGACQSRRAGLDEDYARAFFPTLGMQWKSGWNRELGMVEIYKARAAQAAQLATLHGPRGLPDPWGWAPAYLCGLEGERRHDLTINDNGQLVGEWYSIEVVEHEKSFRWGQTMVVHNLKAKTPGENSIAKVQISTRTGAQLRSSYAEQVQLDEKQTAQYNTWLSHVGTSQATFLLCQKQINMTGRSVALIVLMVALCGGQGESASDADRPILGADWRGKVYSTAALTMSDCSVGVRGRWFLL